MEWECGGVIIKKGIQNGKWNEGKRTIRIVISLFLCMRGGGGIKAIEEERGRVRRPKKLRKRREYHI